MKIYCQHMLNPFTLCQYGSFYEVLDQGLTADKRLRRNREGWLGNLPNYFLQFVCGINI